MGDTHNRSPPCISTNTKELQCYKNVNADEESVADLSHSPCSGEQYFKSEVFDSTPRTS